MSTKITPVGREPAPAEFWDNLPEHFDTRFGVLHDRRYDRKGESVTVTDLPLRDDPPDYCIPDDLPEFDDYWLSWAEPDDTLREQREES